MKALILRGLDTVAAYYRMFTFDTSYWYGDFTFAQSDVVVTAFPSFLDMLRTIRTYQTQGETEFLIGCHGNPNGLPIPLVPGTPVTSNHDLLDLLSSAADGSDRDRTQLSRITSESGRAVFRNAQILDDLIGVIQDVRRNRITRLEFRACNIAAGPALAAIHQVLGSEYTVAPDVLFVWVTVRPGRIHAAGNVGQQFAQFRERLRTLGSPRRIFSWDDCWMPSTSWPSGVTGTDPALAMSIAVRPATGRPGTLHFDAVNQDVVFNWAHSHLWSAVSFACGQLPPGGGYVRGRNLPLIGLWTGNSSLPHVFPGDGSDYTAHLTALSIR
jgi:hypothetical protein